jgi:hypothetical protein
MRKEAERARNGRDLGPAGDTDVVCQGGQVTIAIALYAGGEQATICVALYRSGTNIGFIQSRASAAPAMNTMSSAMVLSDEPGISITTIPGPATPLGNVDPP